MKARARFPGSWGLDCSSVPTVRRVVVAAAVGGLALAVSGQEFRNLDFEEATLVPVPGAFEFVDFSAAFPGWTGGVGPALCNAEFLDSAGVSILGTNYGSGTLGLLHGRFCVGLEAGNLLGEAWPGALVDVSIAQSGTVPSDAKTLLFNARGLWVYPTLGNATLQVSLGAWKVLSVHSDYLEAAVDVSAFAGRSAGLTFTAPILWRGDGSSSMQPIRSHVFLDDIRFSNEAAHAPPYIFPDSFGGSRVNPGSTVRLSMGVTGDLPITYEWFFNATNAILGATSSELVVTNVQGWDSGVYTMLAANEFGVATSPPVLLTIAGVAPTILKGPADQTARAGESVTFRVEAQGSPPLGYQWFLNDDPIPGGISSNLLLTNIRFAQAGAYRVVVKNAYGEARSVPAALKVFPAYTMLHRFDGEDGWGPWGALVSSGRTLYGTTRLNYGTVFKIGMDGSEFSVLHRFKLNDGADPTGSLLLAGGTLYGTTQNGGIETDPGTIYKVNTDGSGFTILKDFSSGGGRWPVGSLRLSGTTLYGATYAGGAAGNGTLFKINTDGSGYSVLHSFLGYPADGRWPDGGMVMSGTTLYGATPLGGGYGPPEGFGTLFKIEVDGSGYTILKQFTGSDGIGPYGGLVLMGTTLYGIVEGGASPNGKFRNGAVFKINTDGSGYSVLYEFLGPPNDGAMPYGGLVADGTKLYGTTTAGGSRGYSPVTYDNGYGTVYQINTDGSGYCLLHEFTGDGGAWPYAGLVLDGNTLYGTTSSGGVRSEEVYRGVVFALSLPVPQITTPPVSRTAEIGSSASFDVRSLDDPPAVYRWFFNGAFVSEPTTNSKLRLPAVEFSQGGTYAVVVSNVFGAVTSAPAALSVIPSVERGWVPGLLLKGEAGSHLNLQFAASPGITSDWTDLESVPMTDHAQWCFDLTMLLPDQRVYRVWQTGTTGLSPSLDIHMVPALRLVGNVGSVIGVEGINQIGPTDAWYPLAVETLTNTMQLYFDTSVIGQPRRLYRLVPGNGNGD